MQTTAAKQNSPIAAAVEPLRQRAVEQAQRAMREAIERAYAELEAANWDFNVAAPHPNSMFDRRPVYLAKQARRIFLGSITSIVKSDCYLMNRPRPVCIDRNAAELRIIEAGQAASASFDTFVAKLESKVGPHTAATLSTYGNVWGNSLVTVETPAGVQKWKTQQIINVSVLGKLFNQWPTRLVK